MFGTALSTYTMPGITSAASAAAQTGPTQIVTADAGGNLATTSVAGLGLATSSQINAINGELANLSDQVGAVKRGIAATAAIAYAATPSGPGRTTFAINGSLYDSTGGVGFSFAHRLQGTTIPMYVSGSYGNGAGRGRSGALDSPGNGSRGGLSRDPARADRSSPRSGPRVGTHNRARTAEACRAEARRRGARKNRALA